MAKFYIVAREKDDYSLISVNKGTFLEDIDLLTSSFTSRKEFIEYLKEKGYSFSDDVDLFAVNKGRKEFYHRELIFGNYDLTVLAKRSKDGKLDVTDTCNILLQKAQGDFEFQDLIRKNTFELYGELRTIVLNSLRNRKIRIAPSKNWMRHNYYVGRDSIAAIDVFEKEKSKFETTEDFSSNKKELNKQRQLLDKYLDKKIDCDNEQISLVGEPISYINLTYVNKQKLIESTPKKVQRMSKMGIKNTKYLDNLTIPYDLITDEIDYHYARAITKCLLEIPYRKVKWGQKERYEADLKKWFQGTDIELNDSDIKFLNSLLDTKLRHDAYWNKYYDNQLYPTAATKREAQSYKNSIFNTLSNSAIKQGETYNKAYNFYLIYKELTREKDNNRGGYGK